MRALIVCLAIASSGCGVALQTAFGWSDVETRKLSQTKTVAVTSVPAGARIVRRGPDGSERELGTAPLSDGHDVQVEETVERSGTTGLWIGFAAELGTAGLVYALWPQESRLDATDNFDGTIREDSDSSPPRVIAGLAVLGAIVDLIVALVHGGSEKVSKRETLSGGGEYTYVGRIDGLSEAAMVVKVPEQTFAHLVFESTGVPPATPVETKPPAQIADASWVIAVMNVEDANADDRARAVDRSLVRNLGDQIRVFIAQQGVRTVDRGAQEKFLREQIKAMKSESYKSCYEEACQVELGKALAASHIMRTRITRFGGRCVLNGELIDLKAEVTMAAASAQGTCEAEGFLTMGEEVARNLLRTR
jgi:hypothetical protein